MNNRWSDAARAASIAVRSSRGAVLKPVAGGEAAPMPMKGGGLARNDVVVTPFKTVSAAGASPAGGNNPGPHIWIPPPDDPVWGNPKFVESFKQGVAERKAKEVATATFPTKPNIFYSSIVARLVESKASQKPKPGKDPTVGAEPFAPYTPVKIVVEKSFAPKTNSSASGGVRVKGVGVQPVPQTRLVIAGKRYTKVGNMYYPDTSPPPAKKLLAATPKRK